MNTKLQIKSDKIIPFGGFFFVNKFLKQKGIPQLIDKELGIRSTLVGYQYSEIIHALFDTYLCGGDHIEDISYIGQFLRQEPCSRIPSSDTIGRAIKELAVENVPYKSDNQTYNFNINSQLNKLLIKINKRLGLLSANSAVDVDFDHQLIPTEKYDAKMSYKKTKGYFPGVASAGGCIIYVENRDGNINVRFHQADTLKRMLMSLEEEQIAVNQFRADCGSYYKDVVELIAEKCQVFYLRAAHSQEQSIQIGRIENWQQTEINYQRCDIASIAYRPLGMKQDLRLVVQRTEIESGQQLDLFKGKYIYRSIITNDWQHSEQDIIEIYNKRGARERDFDQLNNDFGWKHPPCSFLKQNTVFLILMAICKNIFTAFLKSICKVFASLTPTSRVKRFLFSFVNVPAKWILSGRQWYLKLYTRLPYDKLGFF